MPHTTNVDTLAPAAREATAHIASATGLLILAGAGMGVDSGLPDFRGDSGFWRAYPALRNARIRLTDIATPQAFEDDPALAWGFYGHRLNAYRGCLPHAGFGILARWAESVRDGWWVSTTNVDGQFQRAGFDADYVHEPHGTIHDLQCSKPCGSGDIWPASALRPRISADLRWQGELPRCRRCGAVARPNILMFGDFGWIESAAESKHWALVQWLDEVERLAVIEIGAGTAIPTLRRFGEQLVQGRNAKLVRINPHERHTDLPGSVGLATGALHALTLIDRTIAGR